MISRTFKIISILLLIFVSNPVHATMEKAHQGLIRVGIFPFEPFNFIDSNGVAQGLNPDLLREIVRDEQWKFQFVQGSWAEGLERLEKGEIDLMVSVAYSSDRAKSMDYTYESVVELWGQVFVRPDGKSFNINDLSGRKIAVMRKDISGSNFIKTAEKLGIPCEIQELDSHADVFAAVQKREADAGVAPQHFGLRHTSEYNLVGSTILFSPFSIYFASKKGTQHELLSHIDANLSKWKREKDSFYYQSLNKWLSGMVPRRPIPVWLVYSLIAAVASSLVFSGFIIILKRTVRRKTEELRKSEAQYRELVENANSIIMHIDNKGQIIFFNEFAQNFFGFMPHEVIGKSVIGTIVPETDREGLDLQSQIMDVVSMPELYITHENENIRKDGTRVWIVWNNKTFYNTEGEVSEVLCVGNDITKRKQTEKALQASEEALRESQKIAQVGSWSIDLVSNQVVWSDELYKMYGLDREFSPPSYSEQQKLFTTESWERLSAAVQKTRDTGIPYDLELATLRIDGSSGWLWVHGSPVFDTKGKTVGLRGMAQDITGRKQAEEEKKYLTAQLHQSQKMEAIGTLAGGIAHDFNNILGAILGYAEMIREDCPADSTIVHDIDQVLKAATRAKDLVKQILAFSRRSEANIIPVQPANIITEAITMLRASLPTTIDIKQDIDLNAGAILADPTQIHQIMMNLGTNAFHAMELRGGTLTISLQKKVVTQEDFDGGHHLIPGNFVQLSFKDTGVGIAPEVRKKIFDPYFTTKEVGKGTGMGLAMVHGIVQSYGGSITCDSRLGEGTIFHVTLPTVDPHTLQAREREKRSPGGKEHILLIDDEEMLAEMGKAMLERLGYRVTARTNSIEALTTFRNQPEIFDLIITDQTMPGLTGVDLARLVLQIRPNMPIILCTGYSNLISEEKAKSTGIKGFALKPLTKKDIGNLVRKVLDGERT